MRSRQQAKPQKNLLRQNFSPADLGENKELSFDDVIKLLPRMPGQMYPS